MVSAGLKGSRITRRRDYEPTELQAGGNYLYFSFRFNLVFLRLLQELGFSVIQDKTNLFQYLKTG